MDFVTPASALRLNVQYYLAEVPLDQDLQTSSFISTRNPETGDPVQVFAASTVKWSSGTNWRDIVVEAHDITALETPEFGRGMQHRAFP